MRLLACLIVAPQRGYDEPAILSYEISSFCPTSADGLHSWPRALSTALSPWFLQCAGFPPRSPNFRRLRHFQHHRRKLSPSPPHPKARKLLRLQGHQSSEIGAVNSPKSAAKRPINSNSSSAPEGQGQRILTSTARGHLLASGRRNPMFSSSRSSLRARSTRVGAVPTVLSRPREPVMIWRC